MLPEGDKGPYSLYFLLWDPRQTHPISRGCVLQWDQLLTPWVWGTAGSCRGFQGGVYSHMSTSLKSLLCSNANVCLTGLWMLSRTGNGWEGRMSCAKGCRDQGGDTSCTSSSLAPSRAQAGSLGHPEVTLVLVPPPLLQSLMSLCRGTLLLCLTAASSSLLLQCPRSPFLL